MKAIIGYFMLYSCATMIDVSNRNELLKCTSSGPGSAM
jgi:hypothetical protein